MHRASIGGILSRWCVYVTCAGLSSLFRYLHFASGVSNDHFVYITGGWQMLTGEWPTRDWADGGAPLMVAASALSQALFGETMFAEAVLVSLAFGVAAAVTCASVRELTGSLGLGVAAALLEVAIVPRTYAYPKMLVYAVGCLCIVRYVRGPGTGRLLALALAVAFGFLSRHDHGVFLGVGATVAVFLADCHGWQRGRRVALFWVLTAALLLPYFGYVQMYEGLARHFGIGVGLGRQEFGASLGHWSNILSGDWWSRGLVLAYHAIPLAALERVVARCRTAGGAAELARIVPLVAVAVLVNATFLRSPIDVRLPDAIVPAVVLGSWLASVVLVPQRVYDWTLAGVAIGVVMFSAVVLHAGDTGANIARAGLTDPGNLMPRLGEDTAELRARWPERSWPSRQAASLRPFYDYLERCTTREHRLLVGGFLVDAPFFARRRFAGGQRYFGGSYGHDEEGERRALERLRVQLVPFALLPSDYAESFDAAFPGIAARLKGRYEPMATVSVAGDVTIGILRDSMLAHERIDVATGWPCFTR